MPHRCMECKNTIEGSSIDLSSGCPVCGGKKFQYIKPAKKAETDPHKITVIEYVAQAAEAEAKSEEKKPRPKALSKPEKVLKVKPIEVKPVAVKPIAAAPEVKVESKPPHVEKKNHHERIESVRILESGRYDLNLPILLSRKELVMSREDGVYVVDLPSALKMPKKKSR